MIATRSSLDASRHEGDVGTRKQPLTPSVSRASNCRFVHGTSSLQCTDGSVHAHVPRTHTYDAANTGSAEQFDWCGFAARANSSGRFAPDGPIQGTAVRHGSEHGSTIKKHRRQHPVPGPLDSHGHAGPYIGPNLPTYAHFVYFNDNCETAHRCQRFFLINEDQD